MVDILDSADSPVTTDADTTDPTSSNFRVAFSESSELLIELRLEAIPRMASDMPVV
jgi:hypothetical protein